MPTAKGDAEIVALPEHVDEEPVLFYRTQVEEVFHHSPRPIMHVYFGGGNVGVTHEHPWYVKDKGWIWQAGGLCLVTH